MEGERSGWRCEQVGESGYEARCRRGREVAVVDGTTQTEETRQSERVLYCGRAGPRARLWPMMWQAGGCEGGGGE